MELKTNINVFYPAPFSQVKDQLAEHWKGFN